MADFTWDEYWPMRRTAHFSTVVSQFENGMEARRQRWPNPRREYHFRISPLFPWNEVVALSDFFVAKKGASETFTFYDIIDAEDVNVRFINDAFPIEIRHKKPSAGQYATDGMAYFDIGLIEVL